MIGRLLFWLIWLVSLGSYGLLIFWAGDMLIAQADGALPFDLRPQGYTLEEVLSYLSRLGEEGREIYRNYVYPVDTVFPTAAAIALVWTTRAMSSRAGRPALFGLLPAILYLIADHWENQMILQLMNIDPELISQPQVNILQTVTQFKFGFFALAFLIMVRAVFRRRR